MSNGSERIKLYLPSTGCVVNASVDSIARNHHEAVGFDYFNEADRAKVESRRAELKREYEKARHQIGISRDTKTIKLI